MRSSREREQTEMRDEQNQIRWRRRVESGPLPHPSCWPLHWLITVYCGGGAGASGYTAGPCRLSAGHRFFGRRCAIFLAPLNSAGRQGGASTTFISMACSWRAETLASLCTEAAEADAAQVVWIVRLC